LWLRLVDPGSEESIIVERTRLLAEANELKLIFASIAAKDDTNSPA
jgi:hypothetical protein